LTVLGDEVSLMMLLGFLLNFKKILIACLPWSCSEAGSDGDVGTLTFV
jgi:hypothetical protein